jgi:hypothetical protein
MDLRDDFPRVKVETRVLVPSFTPQILSDPKRSWAKQLFIDSWENVRGVNPRIAITEDQPSIVRDAIDELAQGP